jgi:outer membrane receptor protein involved in Fe transport
MRRWLSFLLSSGLTFALASPALAQTTTGSIAGTVKDATGAAIRGVSVNISGPTIVGTQSATTNASGFYRVIGLPPGVYEVTFSLQGFTTQARKGLRVSVGSVSEVNADLAMSQMSEQVEVVGTTSAVDTSSNEVGSTLDRSFVENIPTRRTSFFDLIAAAPGSLAAGEGSGDHSASTRTMVYGSSYDDNTFKLDGVDITDNYWGEALGEPNVDAIEEIQVLSLGAPAEYGNLQGAVYNIVTRQGTNDFHGDANFYFQPKGMTSDNLTDVKNPNGSFVEACPTAADPNKKCPFTRKRYHDFSAQLGGPLVKDKLWFFASYQYTRDAFSQVGVDSSFSGLLTRDRFMGKLNWQVSPRHKVVASFHMDKGNNDRALSPGEAPTRAYSRRHKTPVLGATYSGVLSDKTVVEASYSGFYASVHGGPTDPNQPKSLTRVTNYDTGELTGGPYYFYSLDPYRRQTASAKVSHLADDFLGAGHDFRFGVQYSKGEVLGTYGLNNAVYIYGGYTYGYQRTPFQYSGVGVGVGAFADDTVRVNDRLSLNLGARYDYNKAYSDAIPERLGLAAGDGTPTGKVFPRVDYFTWNSVSPRVGFNWKLTSDGKTVFRGHWGQYRKAVATGEFANRLGPSITPSFSGSNYNFQTGQFEDLVQTSDPTIVSVAPGYFSPHTDQFIVSLDRELLKNMGASLSYVHKYGDNFAAWEPIGGVFSPVTYVDSVGQGATGQSLTLSQLQNSRSALSYVLHNDPRMYIRVNAVSLGLVRRFSGRWSANANLTWMRSTGRLPQSREGVEVRQLSGIQFRPFGQDPNDFVNTDGRQRGDVEWQFKTQLAYKMPWDMLASANVSSRSGANLIRQAGVSSLTNLTTTVLLQKRGENGRLPSVTFVDLRLEKDVKLQSNVRLGVSADVFNLLNNDAPQRVRSSRVTSSVFNWPRDFVLPRRFMLGAKLKF